MKKLRLGINIDHVATLRNARGGVHPDPIRAAKLAIKAGADSITAHLREDRRHIRDTDIARLMKEIKAPLNLEMAATPEMLKIALRTKPHAVCLVPEKRAELTTEGGLDVAGNLTALTPYIAKLNKAGIRVSLFIDPEAKQLEAAKKAGAPVIEIHTGSYCHAKGAARKKELKRIVTTAALAEELGLECHAGHGLDYDNVSPVAAITNMRELNIGHFLVGEALFVGLEDSIRKMRKIMNKARRS